MKTRFFGTVLVLAILAALFIATEGSHTNPGAITPVTPSTDTGFQPLKIN
jgi:hypothetical protein